MFFSFKTIWHAGDTPPKDAYFCAECGSDYSYFPVNHEGIILPHCPVCGGEEWMRI